MTRPALEVADILRAQGDRFLERYRSSFGFQQLKVFRAIQRCRTPALGGHRDACLRCGYQTISYNSCRNRHCPKCQAQARERWLAARELLDTSWTKPLTWAARTRQASPSMSTAQTGGCCLCNRYLTAYRTGWLFGKSLKVA